jgi:Pyruvate/2-oxoacid:ferredoxin oxidoreductase delta subunit
MPIVMSRTEFIRQFPLRLAQTLRELTSGLFSPESEIREKPSSSAFVAMIDAARCLAWGGTACQACVLACPLRDRAIALADLKPVVDSSVCDGCALCQSACRNVNQPRGAIEMVYLKGR